jgi:glycosyltransferase involved in cell wall biosynthesis
MPDPSTKIGHSPTVGIGMPVFNGEQFIEEAIESLLAQTCEDFELVIVDNHSTDGTYEICQRFASQDPRVRCIRQRQNYGVNHNFNSAFRLTSGEYFKWAAYDDVCAPEFLTRCVEVLDSDPSVVLVYPEMPWIDETGSRLESRPRNLDLAALQMTASSDAAERFAATMHNFWYTEHLDGLIRSSALAKTRLYHNHFMADHILLSELCLYGRFQPIPEPLLFLRRHSEQSSKAPSARKRLALVHPESTHPILANLAQYPNRLYFHVLAVRRAPLSRRTRIRCYLAVLRTIMRWARIRISGA